MILRLRRLNESRCNFASASAGVGGQQMPSITISSSLSDTSRCNASALSHGVLIFMMHVFQFAHVVTLRLKS